MLVAKMSINDLPEGVRIMTTNDMPTWSERLEYLQKTIESIDILATGIRARMFGSYPQESSHKVPEACIDDVILNACQCLDDIYQTLQYVNQRIS